MLSPQQLGRVRASLAAIESVLDEDETVFPDTDDDLQHYGIDVNTVAIICLMVLRETDLEHFFGGENADKYNEIIGYFKQDEHPEPAGRVLVFIDYAKGVMAMADISELTKYIHVAAAVKYLWDSYPMLPRPTPSSNGGAYHTDLPIFKAALTALLALGAPPSDSEEPHSGSQQRHSAAVAHSSSSISSSGIGRRRWTPMP